MMWKNLANLIIGIMIMSATATASTIRIGGTNIDYYLVKEPFYGRNYEQELTGSTGHLTFNITTDKGFAMNPNIIKTWKKWQNGNITLKKATIYVLSNVTYNTTTNTTRRETCTKINETVNNETGETREYNKCLNDTVYITENKNGYDWLPITTWSAKAGQTYYIDIELDFMIGMGKSSTDIEVNFSGRDLNFTTFNASMSHKMLNTQNYSTGVSLANFPYIVNGSTGFNVTGTDYTQYVWALTKTVNGSNYIYYNNNTEYQMTNYSENEATPFEIERGNSTSYMNTSVWDSNYVGVWHLSEPSGTVYDSTGRTNLTATGTVRYNTSGAIAAGYSADGGKVNNDYLGGTGDPALNITTGELTMEAWVYFNGAHIGANANFFISNKYYAMGQWAADHKIFCWITDTTTWNYNIYTSFAPTTGTWYYIACTWKNGVGWKIYVNGLHNGTVGTGGKSLYASTSPVIRLLGSSGEVGGNITLDEARISNIAREPSYFNATYESMRGAFSTFGTEQSNEEGAAGAFNITITSPANTTYLNESQPVNMSLNYTINLNGKTLDKIWYNLNGSNETESIYTSINQTVPGSNVGRGINTTRYIGQTFSYASNNITIIDIKVSMGRVSTPTCNLTIKIRNVTDTDLPDDIIYSSTTEVNTSTMTTTFQNYTFSFGSNTLDKNKNYTFDVESTGEGCVGTTAVPVVWYNTTEQYVNGNLVISLDKGETWTLTGEDLIFWINANYTTGIGNTTITGNTTFNAYYGWNNITVAMNATDGTYNQSTVFFTVNQTGGAATCWTCYGTKANIPAGTKCQISSLSNLCGS